MLVIVYIGDTVQESESTSLTIAICRRFVIISMIVEDITLINFNDPKILITNENACSFSAVF